jgi:hypothetical protein
MKKKKKNLEEASVEVVAVLKDLEEEEMNALQELPEVLVELEELDLALLMLVKLQLLDKLLVQN